MLNYKSIITLVILLFAFGCQADHSQNENSKPAADSGALPVIMVTAPVHHTYTNGFEIAGSALPNRQVKIYAMTNGDVQTLHADIGSFVKTGQTLAILDNPELKAQMQKAQADLQAKKTIYDRLNSIYVQTPQLTTVVDVQNAAADYKTALSRLDVLKTQLAYLRIKAPFSGVIVKRYVDKGALVQNGLDNPNTMPLFDLQEIEVIRATVPVPESIVPLLHDQTPVDITIPELPGSVYHARVSRMAYGMDESTKTMTVQVDLENTDHKIRPGMYARFHFDLPGHPSILSVPNQAIGYQQQQPYVYKEIHGTVHQIKVKTGLQDADYTEITQPLLQDTDRIVIQGKDLISDGVRVTVKEK